VTESGRREAGSEVCREYEPDRQAMLAALRVVLGLPQVTSPLARPLRDLDPEA
jgi:hypothetical protein